MKTSPPALFYNATSVVVIASRSPHKFKWAAAAFDSGSDPLSAGSALKKKNKLHTIWK